MIRSCTYFTYQALHLTFRCIWILILEITKAVLPNPPKSIKDEVILVTGGSKGIGKQILLRLAQIEPEATFICWGTDRKALQLVEEELKNLGVKRVLVQTVDVTDKAQIAAAAGKIRVEVGAVTMLFNNAGITGPVGNCWSIDSRQNDRTIDVNLNSHLLTVQEFLPAMLKMNKGHVIASCSVLSFLTGPHGTPYIVSKHAVKTFYECLRNDLRKVKPKTVTDNIVVSSVYPGFVSTDLVAPFNFHSRTFPFLTNQLSAPVAAAQIVDGVLRNRESIYVAPFWRCVHTYISMLPSVLYKQVVDFVDIDPLAPKPEEMVPEESWIDRVTGRYEIRL